MVAEVKASTRELNPYSVQVFFFLFFFVLMLALIAMLKATGAWWSGLRLQANQ